MVILMKPDQIDATRRGKPLGYRLRYNLPLDKEGGGGIQGWRLILDPPIRPLGRSGDPACEEKAEEPSSGEEEK